MQTQTDESHDKQQAIAQVESILEMVERLNHCQTCDGTDDDGNDCQKGAEPGDYWTNPEEYHNEESAMQAISEDPLEVENNREKGTFEILLCTGGPACRLVGTLDRWDQADKVEVEYQDWFKPWTRHYTTTEEDKALVTYANQFCFEV